MVNTSVRCRQKVKHSGFGLRTPFEDPQRPFVYGLHISTFSLLKIKTEKYLCIHLKTIAINLLYINIKCMYFYQKSLYFPKQKKKNYWEEWHYLTLLQISFNIWLNKTAEFSLLLYSICCDILILIKNIKKIWSHTEM